MKCNAHFYLNFLQILMEPYHHTDENKGNDFRNTVMEVYNYWLKLDETEVELVLDFAKCFHTYTLL